MTTNCKILKVSGNCMHPILKDSNLILVNCNPIVYNIGDIISFYTETGEIETHRLVGKFRKNDTSYLIHKPDNGYFFGLINSSQLLGVVVGIINSNSIDDPVPFNKPLTIFQLFAKGLEICYIAFGINELNKTSKRILTFVSRILTIALG